MLHTLLRALGIGPSLKRSALVFIAVLSAGMLAGGAAIGSGSTEGSFSPAQQADIGRIVREYLLKNPKVLEEVSIELTKLRERDETEQRGRVLVGEKDQIFRAPLDYVFGNPSGDVTVVEYFDYNCPWCKRSLPELIKLTEADKNVRIVMKEFPILGEGSVFAAHAALASKAQGKYWAFHMALMKSQRVTKANTLDIARGVGIDVAALQKEMEDPKYDRAIQENIRIAQLLGINGTPGFVIDSRFQNGYVPVATLKQILAEIRKEGCKIC